MLGSMCQSYKGKNCIPPSEIKFLIQFSKINFIRFLHSQFHILLSHLPAIVSAYY